MLKIILKENSAKAQTEFYYRFRSFLLMVCRKVCNNFVNGEQLADDIFQNAMIKALKGFKNLYEKLSEDDNKSSKHIKAWLSKIANNELIEFLRKNPDEKSLVKSSRQIEFDFNIPVEENDSDDYTKPSIEKEILDKGLASLTERDKDILMTYLLYKSLDDKNKHLPDDIIENLCKKHDIEKDNLRQIIRRTLLKLKKFCEN